MPTIEYRMDTTGIPHTFVVINNGAGVQQMYGFAPAAAGNLIGPGHIFDESISGPQNDPHSWDYTTGPIEITAEQYNRVINEINNAIANPPQYNLPASIAWPSAVNQCATWANHLAKVGGFTDKLPWGSHGWNPYGQSVWTELSKYWSRNPDSLPGTWDIEGWGDAVSAISPTLGTTPDPLVKTIRYVDPLILDLDGDGLEITPLARGVLFDANGDAIKTATAWAAADDGMLVWDRNGNGLIDSGRELFGDETILANGSKAAHGFAALAELDSNANGKFDALDVQFNNLRIWSDLNQDGISQAGELQTLAQSGVQSISLASTASNANYGDAILAHSGSFTRVDGAGTTSSGQAGSFILAQNNFVRQFVPITVSAEAKALPNIAGSGWVRDLQEAATQSSALIGLLHNVQNASTRALYKDAVATLLRQWGNDSGYASASDQALANGYGLILSDPLDAQEAGWMDVANNFYREFTDNPVITATAQGLQQMWERHKRYKLRSFSRRISSDYRLKTHKNNCDLLRRRFIPHGRSTRGHQRAGVLFLESAHEQ